MQKKIIALAVAGLVSGTAFAPIAPTTVTLYGIVDVGSMYSWGTASNTGTKSMSEVMAGGWDGSRFGIKGTENLGDGLSVGFDMTAGFNIDNGASYGNRLMSEGSSVNLTSTSWGVQIGRASCRERG